jgi:hypothetical protein
MNKERPSIEAIGSYPDPDPLGSGLGQGLEKFCKSGSYSKKYLAFMISFLEFLLISNDRISVKENELYNSFKYTFLFFN